jgi:hypothetical protein
MKKAILLLFLALLLIPSIAVYAHSGGTDSHGGHYDHSTGEYHYHHGYPAHQHPRGVCPYTDSSSSGNSSGSNNSSIGSTSSSSKSGDSGQRTLVIIVICAVALLCLWCIISDVINKKDSTEDAIPFCGFDCFPTYTEEYVSCMSSFFIVKSPSRFYNAAKVLNIILFSIPYVAYKTLHYASLAIIHGICIVITKLLSFTFMLRFIVGTAISFLTVIVDFAFKLAIFPLTFLSDLIQTALMKIFRITEE